MNRYERTQSSILRINDKKTLQLVREVKNEECLWNTDLEDYHKKAKVQRAAEKIAKILNVEDFEAKHVMIKFKNLRKFYCQELKKIAHSLETVGAQGGGEVYQPKVLWFPIMDSFIRPHLQSSRPLMMLSQAKFRQASNNSIKIESCDVEIQDEDWAITSQENTIHEVSSECASDNDAVSNDSHAKRRRVSTTSTPSELSQTRVFLPNGEDQDANRTEDTLDNFGKYIASLLRSLPPEKALRLQPKIVDMIVEVGVKQESAVMVEIDRIAEDSETE